MMKYWKYIIWLLILLSCKVTSVPVIVSPATQYVPYKIWWSCSNELFVSNYIAQRSKNKISWQTQGTYLPLNSPDSSVYSWQLEKSNNPYFYRIIANMNNGVYYSDTLYLKSTAN